MSREHRRKIRWNVSQADDVGGGGEGVVPRTRGRSLHAMVHAQKAEVGGFAIPFGRAKQVEASGIR